MNIKLFDFSTFEEWVANNYETRIEIGAYRCEIRAFSRSNTGAYYMFAVSLANLNPLNIYTDKLFCRRFEFYGDVESLKKWYYNSIKEFHMFWENHIKSTYLKEDNNK